MTLTADDLLALKQALRARAHVLRGEVSGKLEQAADDAGAAREGGDSADHSVALTDSALDLAEAGRDLNELTAIEAALASIDAGSYGVCEQCGLSIPQARLRAQPLALRCVSCQSLAEQARGRAPAAR